MFVVVCRAKGDIDDNGGRRQTSMARCPFSSLCFALLACSLFDSCLGDEGGALALPWNTVVVVVVVADSVVTVIA